MKPLLTLFIIFSGLSALSQPWLHWDTSSTPDKITLFFVGDVMQHAPQIRAAQDSSGKDYNYLPCFQYIRPYWEKADYVLANLETTLSDRNFSGYPQFCAPWQLARDIKQSGVDILTTNNNHSCDKGAAGIRQTIYYLDSLNIRHTGTFTDTSSWISETPLFIRQGPFKIALLSYTYGTNGIPVTDGQVVSMIDTLTMARHIEKARMDTATNIIVVVHWGIEYQTKPNSGQEKLATWLHKNGADIVIGSHPHVVQPIEYTLAGNDTTGVTVFSLGNFVSNQSQRYSNGGIGIHLSLTRQNGRTRYEMKYLSSYVHRPIGGGIRQYYVIPEPEVATISGQQDTILSRQFFQDTDLIINGAARKLD